MSNKPTTTGLTRIFLQKFGARADRAVTYHSCMRPDAIEEAVGDVTPIKCPHPTLAGRFIEVGSIADERERPTSQLVGHYPYNEASLLKELADLECANDVYVVMGLCEDLSIFDDDKKTLVFDSSKVTNYATDPLGALSDSDSAEVNETADLSMTKWYEVLALNYARRADDIVTNEVIDVVVCDNPGCGDCDDPGDGCNKIFALTTTAGGSPSTPADIVYSLDKGVTFIAVDIDTLGAAEAPTALDCLGQYVVVVSNDSASLHYALKSEFTATPAITWTEVTTGFVAGGEPNDISSNGTTAYVVGDGGYVYKTTDPTTGVTVIDAGVALTDNLNAVANSSDEFMIAGGDSGAVVKAENGTTVEAVTPRPVGAGIDILDIAIQPRLEDSWWLPMSDGTLFFTVDGGISFAQSTFTGSGAGVSRSIAWASQQVGFFSHDTAVPLARVFKTKNGGNTWKLEPATEVPTADRYTKLATCEFDPNFLVAVGLDDDAADGIIVVAED